MSKLLHWVAIVACIIIALGFASFASDQLSEGSKTQQAKVQEDLTAGAKTESTAKVHHHGSVRKQIDKASDAVLSPFNGVVTSKNAWVEHGVPTVMGLFCYGFLLVLLANALLPKPKAQGGDWRTGDETTTSY